MASQPLGYYSGLASGLDFYALVDQMMAIERRPAARLESNVAAAEKRKAELGRYRDLLRTVQDAAADFADGSTLGAYSAGVSNGRSAAGETILAASASAGAVPGRFTVEVATLAGGQKNIGTAQASATDPLGVAGTVDLAGATLTIAPEDSLSAVRDRINALNAGAAPTGVTASILKVADGDFRLVLAADETGTAGAFTATDLTGTAAATLGLDREATPATDASFAVDGVWMTRSGNVVADAVEGVRLTLQATEPGRKVEVNVSRFYSAAQDSAQAFVDAYNAVVKYVGAQNAPGGGAGGANPPLYGDAGLRADRGALSTMMIGRVAGLPDDMNALSAAGIELQKDGTLALDTQKFRVAYDDRYAELETLLADRGAALEGFLDDQLRAVTGSIAVKEQSIAQSIDGMRTRVLDVDARLERRREALIRRFTSFEVEISRLKGLQDSMSSQFAQLVPRSDD